MKRPQILATIVTVVVAVALAIPEFAHAIPAFARRHKMSCTTCHAPVPKLKAYGDEFAGAGFMIPEQDKKRDYMSGGDELLWLNKDFPIAVRFDAFAAYEEDRNAESDLQTPWGVKLLSGGTLYKNIGYYFYFYFSERGEVVGLEDAYIHFNDLFGTTLDVMVGQFQTSDPLMKRELRMTIEDYIAYKPHVGESGINLTYDRGVMLPYSIDRTGTDLVALVVNGSGIHEATGERKYDTDKYKNYAFRLNQGIGDFLSVGGYFYYGKESASETTNEVTFAGPDCNIAYGPVEFTGQYLYRKDTNPYFLGDALEFETHAYIAEVVISPQLDRSRYFLTGLYNRVDSDDDSIDYETVTVSGSYLLARNIRLIAEYTRDIEYEFNRLSFGFISAF
jgi:hypothetical protein